MASESGYANSFLEQIPRDVAAGVAEGAGDDRMVGARHRSGIPSLIGARSSGCYPTPEPRV